MIKSTVIFLFADLNQLFSFDFLIDSNFTRFLFSLLKDCSVYPFAVFLLVEILPISFLFWYWFFSNFQKLPLIYSPNLLVLILIVLNSLLILLFPVQCKLDQWHLFLQSNFLFYRWSKSILDLHHWVFLFIDWLSICIFLL